MFIQRRLVDGVPLYLRYDDLGGAASGSATSFNDVAAGVWGPAPRGLIGALLAPVCPSKVVCIGLNYRRHADEMGKTIPAEPLIFLKPNTAVIATGEPIRLPEQSAEIHHEGELALVVAKRATKVSAHEAMDYIYGYTVMNDVTARDIQRREGRYTRAKGFDSFAPLGPTIATGLNPNELTIETRVNGEIRQASGCDDLIFPIAKLVAFVSSIMTLLPGDIISTGTPAGVGPIVHGDVVEVTVSGIGTLRNPVIRES